MTQRREEKSGLMLQTGVCLLNLPRGEYEEQSRVLSVCCIQVCQELSQRIRVCGW